MTKARILFLNSISSVYRWGSRVYRNSTNCAIPSTRAKRLVSLVSMATPSGVLYSPEEMLLSTT